MARTGRQRGETPLHLCLKHRNFDFARWLLKAQLDGTRDEGECRELKTFVKVAQRIEDGVRPFPSANTAAVVSVSGGVLFI